MLHFKSGRIFLHIGINKTGTTSLQQTFAKNQSTLMKQGLLYPQSGRITAAHYRLSNLLGFHRGRTPPENQHTLESLKSELTTEIKRSKPQAILLSSENFVIPGPMQHVKDFFLGMDLYVIVYLRRHDSWWESAYAQSLKMLASPPWEPGFIHFYRYHRKKRGGYGNYRQLLERWERVVGKDKIIVRPYEKSQNQPDLLADFLKSIGMETCYKSLLQEDKHYNESLRPEDIKHIEVIQSTAMPDPIKLKLIKAVVAQPSQGPRQSIIPPALRHKMIMENQEDYAYIAKRYRVNDGDFLFQEPPTDPNEAWEKPKAPRAKTIVERAVQTILQDHAITQIP